MSQPPRVTYSVLISAFLFVIAFSSYSKAISANLNSFNQKTIDTTSEFAQFDNSGLVFSSVKTSATLKVFSKTKNELLIKNILSIKNILQQPLCIRAEDPKLATIWKEGGKVIYERDVLLTYDPICQLAGTVDGLEIEIVGETRPTKIPISIDYQNQDILIISTTNLKTDKRFEAALRQFILAKGEVDGLKAKYLVIDGDYAISLGLANSQLNSDDENYYFDTKKAVDRTLLKYGKPKYLIILGGLKAFPMPTVGIDANLFESIVNLFGSNAPKSVATDELYGDDKWDMVISRMPAPYYDTGSYLISIALENAAKATKKPKEKSKLGIIGDSCGGFLCYLRFAVDLASKRISEIRDGQPKTCVNNPDCYFAPDYCSYQYDKKTGKTVADCIKEAEFKENIEKWSVITFLTHGSQAGYLDAVDKDGKNYMVMTPSFAASLDLVNNPLIFSGACYSGDIYGSYQPYRDKETLKPLSPYASLAILTLIQKGAAAIIAPTSINFGLVAPSSYKLLGFATVFAAKSTRVGDKFIEIKRDIRTWTYWDEVNKHAFQIYGDPTLYVYG